MSARPMRLEIYRTKTKVIKHYANGLPVYRDGWVVYNDGWRWRIRATNGKIIADSGEAYQRLRDCARGAGLVTGLDLEALVRDDEQTTTRTEPNQIEWTTWRITVDS